MSKKFILMLLLGTTVSLPVFAVEEMTLPPVAPPVLLDDLRSPAGVLVEPPPADDLKKVPHPDAAADVISPLIRDVLSPSENLDKVVDAPISSQKQTRPKKIVSKKKRDSFVYPTSASTRVMAQKRKNKNTPLGISKVENINTVDISGPITSSDMPFSAVLRDAYLFNPDLRAARAQTKALFEQLPQATAYFQPQITASGDITHTSTDTDVSGGLSGTEETASLNLAQPLYRGGRTIAGIRAADSRIDAQLARLADAERLVLFRAAESYMDVLKTQATVTVNQKNRDDIERQLKATKDRFHVGDVTRTDVAQSEFRLARAEADLITATGTYRSSRAVFEQIVGAPAPEHLDVPESLFPLPDQLALAITAAEIYHPLVIEAKAEHRAAESAIHVESGSLLPDVSLNAGLSATRNAVSAAYDSSETGQVGVSLSMPLYEGGAMRSRVRAAKYTANERYLKILSARRAAREETVRAFENLASARAEYASRQAQVHAATIARTGVRQEANLGQRTILDALDADLELRDAQIAEITAKRNEIVAEFALASAIGQLVPGNVGIQEQVFEPDEIRNRALNSVLSIDIEKEPEEGR